jgi:hypothetical protein
MVRENSLRGRVILRWEKAGKPDWNLEKTISICIEVEKELKKKGLDRTPQFSRNLKENYKRYIKNWVQGCHFEWINPR